MKKIAIVTGVSGAIGMAIANILNANGYVVCGLDKNECKCELDLFIQVDLNDFSTHASIRMEVINKIKQWVGGGNIHILVNNAAYQYVSVVHTGCEDAVVKSFNVNVLAPYLLITNLAEKMLPEYGSVINMGSIHARLTKPGFVAYSTTKAALSALTRGLAIDYRDKFRINCIEPASVNTPMLVDGFKDNPEMMQVLESFYPQNRIATPEEIAQLVLVLSSKEIRFLHGACVDMSGGISSRLHDPV